MKKIKQFLKEQGVWDVDWMIVVLAYSALYVVVNVCQPEIPL